MGKKEDYKNAPLLYKKPAFEVYNQENTFISLDKAFEYVGDNSSYQKRVIVVLSCQWIFYSFMTLGLPFLVFSQSWGCKSGNEENVSIVEQLLAFKQQLSIGSDFDLACTNKRFLPLVMSIFYIGSCCSGLVFPSLADNYGRKYIMVFSILFGGISNIVMAFTRSIQVLCVCLFLTGFFFNGYETICLVYVTEISAKRFKNFSTVTLMCVWALSQIVFALLSQVIFNWRSIVMFCIAIPILLSVLPMICYLDETPKHLVQIREFNKATAVLRKISITNNRPPFHFHLLGEMPHFNQQIASFQQPTRKQKQSRMNKNLQTIKDITLNAKGYLDLLITRKLRNRTLLLLYIWFIRYYVYFGIQFSLAQYDDFYLSLIFTALGETIANLIGAPIKLKMKRRTSISITLCIMIVSSGVLSQLKNNISCLDDQQYCLLQTVETVCATLLKFSITIYYAILVTYTSESYPTAMRAKAYGLCMTFGKIGSVVVPIQINQLKTQHISPLSYVWLSCLFTLICVYYLPETQKNRQQAVVSNDCQEDSDPEEDQQQQQIIQIEMKKRENCKYVPGVD